MVTQSGRSLLTLGQDAGVGPLSFVPPALLQPHERQVVPDVQGVGVVAAELLLTLGQDAGESLLGFVPPALYQPHERQLVPGGQGGGEVIGP